MSKGEQMYHIYLKRKRVRTREGFQGTQIVQVSAHAFCAAEAKTLTGGLNYYCTVHNAYFYIRRTES